MPHNPSLFPNDQLWPPIADRDFTLTVRRYVEEHVVPEADRIDAEDIYPAALARQMARAGYSSITLPAEYGGGDRPFAFALALFEEVAVGSAALAVSLLTTFQAQAIIRLFGSDTLKRRYLPQFANGLLASYALTEASHGSDIRTLDTKAIRCGERWILTGEKHFITSASGVDFFVILAETDVGVSAFAVPRDTPRLNVYEGRNSATFGLRNGPHMNLALDEVELPADHLIGTEGKGVRQAVTTLDYSRTLAAAISVGIARAAFDTAYEYTRNRRAFGQSVFEFQGIQWYFAEALADIDASRLQVFHAGKMLDTGEDIDRYGSEAKLRAAQVATRTASMAVQVCGAHGTMVNAPYSRFFRDAKTYEIAGGSTEILKNTIGKYLARGGGTLHK
ncbi:alkylation response protein AidB-like acyl-CoA dehydrogenase [Hephaestia caeni]|uniref:Alkylation response protein AidB-like acyl-CoA dehydrogenase n=1 Tax=Hephaestia caeni TaxID=645617 RepID=A0A397P8U1_9SPHN|nr:acyl-CoA dehydrogenase family protein [Hephaestia caeni]RIA45492.1 alkylation response protein AidB-like acyl-CoA dehydrogenase [Hephaestia caeni]